MRCDLPSVKINEIKFNDAERIRQDLDPAGIQELAESITSIGLLNPIVVNRELKLLAGRRRLEAHRILKLDEIEVRWFEDLDPVQQRIVEFDENNKRRQLTWQEEAAAISEIHSLLSARSAHHTLGETAQAVGMGLTKTSELITLSRGLTNERVANRPSREGALQTLKRERELELARELARRRVAADIAPVENATKFGQGIVYNASCLDILKTFEADSIDLIVTDPPWGIGLDKASQWTKKWVPSYDDENSSVKSLMSTVAPELFRILKGGSHLYIFFPIQEIGWWTDLLGAAGFLVRTRPLIWFKTSQPGITDTYTAFLPCYEAVLWAFKPGEGGYRRFFSRPIAEAFGFPRTDLKWHENEKPLDLLTIYVEASSDPNELVLDPFAGGGSTLAAAFGVARRYIGVEADPINYEKCCRRMKEAEEGGPEDE